MKHPEFVFLDTAYANALINTRDQWHERAIVPLSSELFEEAIELYKETNGQKMGAYRLHLVHCDATLWCCRCTNNRRAFSTSRLSSTVTGRYIARPDRIGQ